MFDRLIASGNHVADRSLAPSCTVALLVHAGVCAAAVLATLRPPQVFRSAGPRIVLSWPQPSEDGSHGGEVDALPGPTAPPIDVPPQAPIGIPPIDARLPFDAKVLLRGAGDARGGRAGRDRHPRSSRAWLRRTPKLARRLRGGRAGVRAEGSVPAGAHARAGGAGVGAPPDRVHALADSLTGEPAHRLVTQ